MLLRATVPDRLVATATARVGVGVRVGAEGARDDGLRCIAGQGGLACGAAR